jgi:hypothetical protein
MARFFQFLKAPTSALIDLKLTGHNTINDETAVDVFSALASNTSLKIFEFPNADDSHWPLAGCHVSGL